MAVAPGGCDIAGGGEIVFVGSIVAVVVGNKIIGVRVRKTFLSKLESSRLIKMAQQHHNKVKIRSNNKIVKRLTTVFAPNISQKLVVRFVLCFCGEYIFTYLFE